MVHDFSPFLLRLGESFGLRWYGVSYLLAFLLAYLLIVWMVRRQRYGLTVQMVGDLVTYGAIGILLGGRFGYCIFYAPDLFIQFKTDFPFWGVLALNEGGMSSHGGMIGLIVALTLFSMRTGVNQVYLYDLAALVGPVGIFFGRIANFINGELVGRAAEESYQYAVKFPQDILYWPQYEMQKLGALGSVIEKIPGYSKEKWLEWVDQYRVQPEARNQVQQGLNQIIDAIQSGNQQAKEAIAPLLTARHPSQLYAAVGEGLFIFLFLFILWYKPRKPGVVGAWFVILYAFIRIIDEKFRMPDVHLGYGLLGLTRGQWLSSMMLLLGIWLLFFYGRRMTLPEPGWGLGQHVRIHRRS
jgi:phosphatidylglycerol---prolipoprotein diacylglyceryl transferase